MAAQGRIGGGMVTKTEQKLIQINQSDNAAVALRALSAGETVSVAGREYSVREPIPFGHKMALENLAPGDMVIKYGCPIGHVTQAVQAGEWLHSHNVKTNLEGLLEYAYHPAPSRSALCAGLPDTFWGYRRADGRAGVRNELWIIPTVSCVNRTVERMARTARERGLTAGDGIFAFPHNAGCSQLGDDFKTTQRLLANLVRHPNAGGVLLVSLGCENNDLEHFLPVLGDFDSSRIRTLVTQDVEGDEVEAGLALISELSSVMAEDRREELPVSCLTLGFKCGGSDAFSGITANPLCGRISEYVTSLGGTAVLTEVPEMFGAEQQLMDRADSRETFDKVVSMINSFKGYYIRHQQPIYENPSPGNKRGGITTLEEKSLGCIQKGGHAPVTDTLEMGETCRRPGLNLMTGPGNDSVSVTNLLSSGAQIILFTTGRGNPLGTAAPTIKVASNSALFRRKGNWMDFNAGQVLEYESSEPAAQALWQLVLDVASGRKRTKSEENDDREIMIFKDGVIL